MEHVIEHTVRSTELDVIGHVNNAKYLEYMEWSRFDWIIGQGLSLDELQRRRISPVVVSIQINYRKELKLGEKIRIATKPLHKGNKSFVLYHFISNEAGDIVSDAEVTMVMIDARLRRATELPPEVLSLFE